MTGTIPHQPGSDPKLSEQQPSNEHVCGSHSQFCPVYPLPKMDSPVTPLSPGQCHRPLAQRSTTAICSVQRCSLTSPHPGLSTRRIRLCFSFVELWSPQMTGVWKEEVPFDSGNASPAREQSLCVPSTCGPFLHAFYRDEGSNC